MKSPLKDKPLRNPGDSTQRALDDFLLDKVFFYLYFVFIFFVISLVDWYRHITETPVNPWPFTLAALIAVLVAAYKVFKAVPVIRNMKLGRDGERAVGQYLERLRESGAKVIHDIPGDGFNIDHVVIAPAGIFVIETKTYSKPDAGEPTLTFDGEKVTLRGRGSFTAPVIQVTAGARWLKGVLKESTGKELFVRPVLLFPGWYIPPESLDRSREIWVLEPKALPAFINKCPRILSAEDVNLAAYHLSRYVRTA